MPLPSRPHLLGIDDGPFEKRSSRDTPIVGVLMEGRDVVEAVATTAFPIDGDGVTDFLAAWIEGLRFRPSLQGVVLGVFWELGTATLMMFILVYAFNILSDALQDAFDPKHVA